jgi:hypothetical protein
MTTTAKRLADLEQQVADLADRLEKYHRQAAALRTLEQAWFEVSGWQPAQRPAPGPSPARHLRAVGGGAS